MSRMMSKHRAQRTASATDFQTDRGLDIEQPSTDDVRVSVKTAGAVKGTYVALFQTPKNTLELIPNHTAVAEFINDHADHLGDDILAVVDPKGEKNKPGHPRHNVWGDKEVLKELLADLLSNGWHWLNPQDIGALTDAPILEAPDGRIYWHEGYQLESAADELLQGKTVTLDGAPENHVPAVLPVEDEMPKTSSVKTKKADNEAAEDAATADATGIDPALEAPAPAPALGATSNPYQDWKTQNLIETIESLTDSESFAQDKPEQKAVENMAEVLSARPVEPELDAQAKKSCLRKAAAVLRLVKRSSTVSDLKRSMNKFLDEEADEKEHKKAGFGGGFPAADQDNGEILEGDKSIPVGREFEEDNTGIDKPAADSARKFADINDPAHNEDTGKVLEGDKSVAEKKDGVEDNTGIDKPSVETPTKVASGYEELGVKTAAAPITIDKAIKLIENLSEELKGLYLDAKPIITVNETRQVREAVESIYHAMKALGLAQKILVKQQTQQTEEAAAAEANASKAKKSSSLLSALKIAAAEPEIKTQHVATFKDRATFRAKVAKQSSIAQEAALELGDAIMRSASAYGAAHRASEDEDATPETKEASAQKKAQLKTKITSLAKQLGCAALYRTAGAGKTIALKLASGEKIAVPTS
jgi:hypothetical protein